MTFGEKQAQQVICRGKSWQTRTGRSMGLGEQTLGAETETGRGKYWVRDTNKGWEYLKRWELSTASG